MKIDRDIMAEIKKIPVPYEIEKRRDHYFLVIPGMDRICIGGNHNKNRSGTVSHTIRNISNLIQKLKDKKVEQDRH